MNESDVLGTAFAASLFARSFSVLLASELVKMGVLTQEQVSDLIEKAKQVVKDERESLG